MTAANATGERTRYCGHKLIEHMAQTVRTGVATRPVRVGLVLSAGGLRGAAHVGVLRQLIQHEIPIHVIVGVSAGAVIAAYYAAVGLEIDELIGDAAAFRGRHLLAHSLNVHLRHRLEPEAGVPLESTATVGRMLTPEYASPEQVRGEPVAATSDIYSLGVLLYRLLSGRSPYRVTADAPHDVARAIAEQDPPKLTSRGASSERLTAHAYRAGRDLDAIICKAMRKRPADRYESVEALADDLRRYRARLPVRARRGTLVYRSGRFVSCHRAAARLAVFAAPALVFLTLWAGGLTRSR